jgi:hypothetical protein
MPSILTYIGPPQSAEAVKGLTTSNAEWCSTSCSLCQIRPVVTVQTFTGIVLKPKDAAEDSAPLGFTGLTEIHHDQIPTGNGHRAFVSSSRGLALARPIPIEPVFCAVALGMAVLPRTKPTDADSLLAECSTQQAGPGSELTRWSQAIDLALCEGRQMQRRPAGQDLDRSDATRWSALSALLTCRRSARACQDGSQYRRRRHQRG